ncbi:hypothetical protein A4A49_16847 [Nicotiana attenuata]|uniref:Ubiquitin-like protease family profile domain-containing protein n=1 Tax=Nicotiana attenuata TaxID=49451 RepID=A0A314KNP4_NICAT|nr:hypothetical protein A4A49_16847 [Nicotiana attenuata]
MKDMKERQKYKGDSYNLYGFPWALLAWAFEAIPQLRPKDYPKERTLPRMKRWLFEKVEKDRPDPFQIKDRLVVHPFLYPTKIENMKPYIQNLVILYEEEDMMIDNLSKELDGAIVLRHLGGALKIEKDSLQTPQVGDSHVVGGYDDRAEKSIGEDGGFRCSPRGCSIMKTLRKFKILNFGWRISTWRISWPLCVLDIEGIPKHYDQADIILDCNFFYILKERYNSFCDGVDKVNAALSLPMIFNEYQFHKDDLKYARGELPFCGGRPWNGTKRIFYVYNIERKHYVTVVFLVEESKMLIYDYNTFVYTDEKLGEFLYPISTMFPRYLRSCGFFMHLAKKSFNDDWIPKRVFDLPRDDTSSSCGAWSLMFIEHLITNTPMDKMNGNIVSEFGEKWLWISFTKILNHDMICN